MGITETRLDDGRVRLRWRERVDDPGAPRGWKWGSRSYTTTPGMVTQLKASIERSLLDTGSWSPTVAPAPEPVITAADLLEGMERWYRARLPRLKPGTRRRYRTDLDSIASALREVTGISSGPIPVTLLSRQLVLDLQARWGEGQTLSRAEMRSKGYLGPQTLRDRVSRLLTVWSWLYGDLTAFPLTPPPNTQIELPRGQEYNPTRAPTLAEVDACLSHMSSEARAPVAWRVAIIMRYTGLRVFQAASIRKRDVNLVNNTLRVAVGKKQHEIGREVPISRHLAAHFRVWLAPLNDSDIVCGSTASRATGERSITTGVCLARAWQRATDAGDVPETVWRPHGRVNARPDHAFRAAIIDHLYNSNYSERYARFLVGHAPAMVDRHYAPPKIEDLRPLVDSIPEIDLGTLATNVVRLA